MALIKKVGTTRGLVPGGSVNKDDQGGTRQIDAPQTLQPGTVLQQRYAVEGQLGVGGMSVVYRGRDLRFKDVVRSCAIKEIYQITPDPHTRRLNLANFEREAGLLATLQHPAIPKIFDFFEENGRVYLILEQVLGKDLEAVLEEAKQPLDEARVGRWAVQICDVLSYLHTHHPESIVFRDMKPSNVMVTADDRIMLIDFGIARTLNRSDRKGTQIGTEGYSPPEQYRGIAEPRGDLYALGATLHHLLTNEDPRHETPFTFHERPIHKYNAGVSPAFEAVVNKALEDRLEDRWASAEEMKNALLGVGSGMAAPSGAAVPALRPTPASNPRGADTSLVWRFTCEDEVRSSPCVANGMLFVGCYDTNLYALDAERGEFRWKYATEGGISSSPAVWQDLVVVGSEDGGVYGLETRRGTLRWTFRTDKPVRSSPRAEDRLIIVGADDQHLYALDGMRGTVIWKYRTWMPIRSSACIHGNAVYFGCNDGHIYAVDTRTGTIKWKQRTQQPVISTPTFGEGLVLVGSMDNNLYALDPEGGWVVWRYRTNHYVNSSPTVLGTRVFVGSVDGSLYALEVKTGRLAWKYETGSQITSSPRAEGGRVYFGAVDGTMFCLDAGSGALIWKYQAGGPIVSSAAVHEGIVYVGSMDNNVYALKA